MFKETPGAASPTTTDTQVQDTGTATAAKVEGNPASEAKTEVTTAGATTEAPKVEGTESSEAGSEPKTDPKAEAAPEKYELKLPEGADQGLIEKIESFAKERGFSNEQAQAILEREVAAVQEFANQTKPNGKVWLQQVEKWEQEALSSKEIGGTPEKLQQSVAVAKKAIAKFFPEESHAFLHESGLGSHPALLTALVRIGQAMGNDKSVKGSSTTTTEKSLAERLYGDSAK